MRKIVPRLPVQATSHSTYQMTWLSPIQRQRGREASKNGTSAKYQCQRLGPPYLGGDRDLISLMSSVFCGYTSTSKLASRPLHRSLTSLLNLSACRLRSLSVHQKQIEGNPATASCDRAAFNRGIAHDRTCSRLCGSCSTTRVSSGGTTAVCMLRHSGAR